MHAILTAAFFVASGLTSGQPEVQMIKTVNGDGSVQEIYRNYFDSLAKNKAMDTKNYRDKLAQESAKEQEDFDTMKGEIQSARQKNAKWRNINKHDATGNRVAVLKREVTEAAVSTTPRAQCAAGLPHDQYVHLYGNDVNTSGVWPLMDDLKDNRMALKDHCNNAYSVRFPYKLISARDARVETETLSFPGTTYQPIRADFLMCHTGYNLMVLHKGLKSNCVFQVVQIDPYGPSIYRLGEHHCGAIL